MTNKTATTLTSAIETAIANSTRIEAEAKAERELLEQALRLAKGTKRDVSVQAQAAVHPPRSVPEQIETLLAVNTTLHEWQIAKSLGLTTEKTRDVMRGLARDHKVYNIGTEQHPRWCWVVGETISGAGLKQHVLKLISAAPLTHRQIEAATGVRRTRVSGALVQLERDPGVSKRLENLGTDRVHVHFVRPAARR